MTENPSPEVPLAQPENPEVGDNDAQRRQDQNRLDQIDPEQERTSPEDEAVGQVRPDDDGGTPNAIDVAQEPGA